MGDAPSAQSVWRTLLSCDLLLCGAGISVEPPAGIPVVTRFLWHLEKTLVRLTQEPARVAEVLRGDRALRFEQIVSSLRVLDRRMTFLDYVRVGTNGRRQPNAYHYLAAEFLELGRDVLTTNFDILIEVACSRRGIPFADRLSKLHGTIEILRNGRVVRASTDRLGATLGAVSRGKGQLTLDVEQERLQRGFHERKVLIVGYSCSDAFDIVPALRRCSPRSVVYCDYRAGIPAARGRIGDVADRDARKLLELWRERGHKITVLRGDPYPHLSARFALPADRDRPPRAPTLEQLIERSVRTSARANLLLGMLLRAQDHFEEARRVLSKALPGLRGGLRAEALYGRARVMPEWDAVKNDIESALPNLRDENMQVEAFIVLLDAESNLGPFRSVERAWQRFRGLLVRLHGDGSSHLLEHGKGLHGLALANLYEGRVEASYRLFLRSMTIRKRNGDAYDHAAALGAICFNRVIANRFDETDLHWQEFLALTESVGGDVSSRDVHFVVAMRALERRDYATALERLIAIEALLNSGEDRQTDPEVLLLQVVAHFQAGDRETAERTARFAVEYAARHGFSWQLQLGRLLLRVIDEVRTRTRNRYFRWFLARCAPAEPRVPRPGLERRRGRRIKA